MPLSAKQTEYLAIAWQCFESEPKIDYDKFHKLAGLASAASARELLRVTKKKLYSEAPSLAGMEGGGDKVVGGRVSKKGTAASGEKKKNGGKGKGKGKAVQMATPVSDDGEEGAAVKREAGVEEDEDLAFT